MDCQRTCWLKSLSFRFFFLYFNLIFPIVTCSLYTGEKPWLKVLEEVQQKEDRKVWEEYFGGIKETKIFRHRSNVFKFVTKSSKLSVALGLMLAIIQISRKPKIVDAQTLESIDPMLAITSSQKQQNCIKESATDLLTWKDKRIKDEECKEIIDFIDDDDEEDNDENIQGGAVPLSEQESAKSALGRSLVRIAQLTGATVAGIITSGMLAIKFYNKSFDWHSEFLFAPDLDDHIHIEDLQHQLDNQQQQFKPIQSPTMQRRHSPGNGEEEE